MRNVIIYPNNIIVIVVIIKEFPHHFGLNNTLVKATGGTGCHWDFHITSVSLWHFSLSLSDSCTTATRLLKFPLTSAFCLRSLKDWVSCSHDKWHQTRQLHCLWYVQFIPPSIKQPTFYTGGCYWPQPWHMHTILTGPVSLNISFSLWTSLTSSSLNKEEVSLTQNRARKAHVFIPKGIVNRGQAKTCWEDFSCNNETLLMCSGVCCGYYSSLMLSVSFGTLHTISVCSDICHWLTSYITPFLNATNENSNNC